MSNYSRSYAESDIPFIDSNSKWAMEIAKRGINITKEDILFIGKGVQAVKKFVTRIVRSIFTCLRARNRAYHRSARSTFSTAVSHDDDGGGEGSDSDDPPARPYPLNLKYPKPKSNSLPLAASFSRHMSHGLLEGRRAT